MCTNCYPWSIRHGDKRFREISAIRQKQDNCKFLLVFFNAFCITAIYLNSDFTLSSFDSLLAFPANHSMNFMKYETTPWTNLICFALCGFCAPTIWRNPRSRAQADRNRWPRNWQRDWNITLVKASLQCHPCWKNDLDGRTPVARRRWSQALRQEPPLGVLTVCVKLTQL